MIIMGSESNETSKERYERVAAELAEVCRQAGRDPK